MLDAIISAWRLRRVLTMRTPPAAPLPAYSAYHAPRQAARDWMRSQRIAQIGMEVET